MTNQIKKIIIAASLLLSSAVFAESDPDADYKGQWEGWQPVLDLNDEGVHKMCFVQTASIRPYASAVHVIVANRACGYDREIIGDFGPHHGVKQEIAVTCFPQKAIAVVESYQWYYQQKIIPSFQRIMNANYKNANWSFPTDYLDKNTLDYICGIANTQ
jgi:hypothetical protein